MNSKKLVLFAFFIAFIIAIIYVFYDLFFTFPYWIKIIFLIFFFTALLFFIIIKSGALLFLKEYERAVVFRFGKLARVGGPGWTLIIPFIESATIVDLRTQTIDIPKQNVITKDNIMLRIDAVIYLKVLENPENVVKSVIKVDDYKKAARLFVESNIRDVIGTMDLSDVISNIGQLNVKIKKELHEMVKDWGIYVDAVEIKEVSVPEEVIDAMHKREAATQKKKAIIELAEAEREKIKAINEAASNLADKSVAYYYIKALEEMSKGKSSKIIFPMEFTKLANMIAGKVKPESKEEEKKLSEFIAKYGDDLKSILDKIKKDKNK